MILNKIQERQELQGYGTTCNFCLLALMHLYLLLLMLFGCPVT